MSKTIFITGATSGFGEACARRFAREGWRLVVTGRRGDRLEKLKAELAPAEIHTAVFDVRDKNLVQEAVDGLPAAFRNVDVLLNNAGLALGLEPAHRCSMDDWETMVDTNIKGLLYCTRALLPGMVERHVGHIVNLGSVAGSYPYPGGNVYGATKAFVEQFSKNIRCDIPGSGVRVTNIEPGMAESEFSLVRFKNDPDKAAKVYAGTKSLQPDDIAEIVWWTTNLPQHVNINRVEVMATCQSWSPFAVHRENA